MRMYGLITTAIITAWGTAEYLVCRTSMEFFHMLFVVMMASFFAAMVFIAITEPRKKKAHWEKSGELEVMVMGRRRHGRK